MTVIDSLHLWVIIGYISKLSLIFDLLQLKTFNIKGSNDTPQHLCDGVAVAEALAQM